MCNAILNTAYHEKSRVSSDAPLGIASTVTPMLTRTSSRRLRQAVTAKSIKHHKWMHANEEVSGDYTESLMQLMQDSKFLLITANKAGNFYFKMAFMTELFTIDDSNQCLVPQRLNLTSA